MDTRINHEGITINLEMRTPPTQLRDGTWAHPAKVFTPTRMSELDKLTTLTLWGENPISVSPTLAKDNQNGQIVNLIMSRKLW